MKLYLASLGIPDRQAYLELLPPSAKVGVIANAWDVYPKVKAEPFIQTRLSEFNQMGCKPELLDLRKFTNAPAALQEALRKFDAIWVTGGNTFYLNWIFRQSGFGAIIKDLVDAGLVYGGESAGATIAGPTLHGVQHLDDPHQAPEVIWDGLGLVDFAIVPHWGREKYAGLLTECKQEMEQNTTEVRTLTDTQSIVLSSP